MMGGGIGVHRVVISMKVACAGLLQFILLLAWYREKLQVTMDG